MAANMFFSRDSKVFLYINDDRYEIPVLDGFSFSQATNASEITLSEMSTSDGTSRRGRQMFNDSFAPAEWSFATYARPFKAGAAGNYTQNDHHAVEEILWGMMVGTGGSSTVSGAVATVTATPATGGGTGYVAGTSVASATLGTTTSGDGTGAAITLTRASGNTLTASVVAADKGSNYETADKLFVSNTDIKNAFNLSATPASNIAVTIASVGTATQDIQGLSSDGTALTVSFDNSNKSTLGTADIYFQLGGGVESGTKIYKVAGCVLNEAGLDFDIEGIAQINWSGMGTIISEVASLPSVSGTTYDDEISGTDNFIRNRLTSLDINEVSGSTYSVVLTGGSVTVSNNITFITPETLGVVNQPLGHVTGTRTVGGSFTCYLNSDAGSSAKLFKNLIEKTTDINNQFNLEFSIGGKNSTPKVLLDMNNCHLEVPTHSIEDVISLETNFHSLPSTIDGTDELTIKYTGK